MAPRDEYPDDSELGGDPPPTVIHNHYSQNRNGNGNGTNKLVWSCAAVLAVAYLGILAFVGAKVWTMSERLVRVETMLEQRPSP